MDKKLLWSILIIIPFLNIIAAIIYLVSCADTKNEKIFAAISIIPGLSIIIGIILVLNATGVLSL